MAAVSQNLLNLRLLGYCTHANCLHRLPREPLVHEELRLAPMFNLVVPTPLAQRHHLPINLVQRRQIIEAGGRCAGLGGEADASLPCSIELACDGSGEADQLSVKVRGALLHRLLLSPHQRFSMPCSCCAFEKTW